MTTKFDINETVLVKAKVNKIEINKDLKKPLYGLHVEEINGKVYLWVEEDNVYAIQGIPVNKTGSEKTD